LAKACAVYFENVAPIVFLEEFCCISGNIANYLKLQEVDSIHLPVPMNFIFIGFEGKGSHGT